MIGKTKEKHPGNASNMQDGADTEFFTLQFFSTSHIIFFFAAIFVKLIYLNKSGHNNAQNNKENKRFLSVTKPNKELI